MVSIENGSYLSLIRLAIILLFEVIFHLPFHFWCDSAYSISETCSLVIWAVKQECVNVNECDVYKGDKDALLCTTALSDTRNMATSGDSGGICLIISILSMYYSFGNIYIYSHVIILNLIISKVH